MNINCPSWVTKKLNNKSSDIPTKQVTLIARSRITTKNQTVSCVITFRWCHLFSPLLRKTSLTFKMCLIQWHPLPITWSYMSADLFFAGFYFTLWTNGYTGFCQGNKNDTRRKTIQFPFRLHINVKQRILICSYTFDIKPTVQLITLNVKDAECDLFLCIHGYYPREIYVRKYWPYSLNTVSHGERMIYHDKKPSSV